MSKKPCGCGNTDANAADAASEATKPEIVPLPPALRERNRARRAAFALPDDLAEMLVPVPEGAEPPNNEGV